MSLSYQQVVADLLALKRKASLLLSDITNGLATKQDTLVSGTNIKTINTQSLLGAGDLAISGAIESIVSNSTELDTLITTANANPSNTYNAVLDASSTLTALKVVPANVYTKFLNGSMFIDGGGGSLEFEGVGIVDDPLYQIFSGFAIGEVTFSGPLPNPMRPEWWGAVGDGTTDDLHAFQKIVSCVAKDKAIDVELTLMKDYKMSDTLELTPSPVSIYGVGGDNWSNLAKMTWAANKTGIICHHNGTQTGVNDGKNAIFSQFKNFAMVGTVGPTTHTVTINGLTVTRTAGAVFGATDGYSEGNTITINGYDYVIASRGDDSTLTIFKPRILCQAFYGSVYLHIGDYNAWPTTGEWDGQNVIIDGATYTISDVDTTTRFGYSGHWITLTTPYLGVAETAGGRSGAFTTGTPGTDTLDTTAHQFETGMAVYVASGGTLYTGLTNAMTAYVIVVDADHIKLASTYANALANTPIDLTGSTSGTHNLYSFYGAIDGEIQTVANTAGLAARPNLFHGLDLRGPAAVEGMKIWSFAGNLIDMDSSKGLGISGTTPNVNNTRVSRNSLYYGMGSGIHLKGINSNQCFIENNDLTNNHGSGIFDGSFLGNNYFGNHTSFNYFAASYFTGDVNVSCLVGEYSEGGQPSSKFPQYCLLIGGNPGAAFDSASAHVYLRSNQGHAELDDLRLQNAALKTVAFRAGKVNSQQNTMFGFGAAEEPTNLSSGGALKAVNRYQYQIGYDQLATGWYDLYQGGQYTDHTKALLAFSGELASAGSGKLAFPTGFRTALTDPHITRILKGSVTINPASIAASTVSSQDFALSGAVTGDSLELNVPAAGLDVGMLVAQSYVSAADTITVVFFNTTGSAIDIASASWTYKLTR